MRTALALLCLVIAAPAVGQTTGPATPAPSVDIERNKARWADIEAQRRITDGDYEGAVRAQSQADSDRRAAARLENFARGPERSQPAK